MIVIDVHTVRKFESGHILRTQCIPIEKLESRFKTDIPLTQDNVFVYCTNGERSRLVCDYWSRQGYLNLSNIHDELQSWIRNVEDKPEVRLIQIQAKPSQSEPHGVQQ